MNWNSYSHLKDKHAFLSASKYHWVNYDEDKLRNTFNTWKAAQEGTELHDLASRLIKFKQKLPNLPLTLNLFVNDCIDFNMQSEQVLYFSENCFGTADGIALSDNVLRISDLKTGKTPTSMKQLKVYAAIFCLEYLIDPFSLDLIETRIYQSNAMYLLEVDPHEVEEIMLKIKRFDILIDELKGGLV